MSGKAECYCRRLHGNVCPSDGWCQCQIYTKTLSRPSRSVWLFSSEKKRPNVYSCILPPVNVQKQKCNQLLYIFMIQNFWLVIAISLLPLKLQTQLSFPVNSSQLSRCWITKMSCPWARCWIEFVLKFFYLLEGLIEIIEKSWRNI